MGEVMDLRASVSSAFIWRRVHSLMGFWLIIYLFEHLLVNSQAALWIGDDGHGFVRFVNSLESLPYLPVIEALLIGLPFAVHMTWGVQRLFQSKINCMKTDGASPSLPYGRNRAYTWQRWTSWILLFGVLAHVIQMRFIERPEEMHIAGKTVWTVQVRFDPGLASLSKRLGVEIHPLYGENETFVVNDSVTAVTPDMGTAFLLVVRDAFKSPLQSVLYSIFVLAAAFHAFNGFWTSLITWGALLSYRSQKAMIPASAVGIGVLSFLGLAAIWGSYWINLRQ